MSVSELTQGKFASIQQSSHTNLEKRFKPKTELDLFISEYFFLKYLKEKNTTEPSFFPRDFKILDQSIYYSSIYSKNLRDILNDPECDILFLEKISQSLIEALLFLHKEGVILPFLATESLSVLSDKVVIRDLEKAEFEDHFVIKRRIKKEPLTPSDTIYYSYASPEVLTNGDLSTKTPLWNAALIIGELFTKKLLCPSDSAETSIALYERLLDTPYNRWQISYLISKTFSMLIDFVGDEPYKPKFLKDLLKNFDGNIPALEDLLKSMLKFTPEERASFEEILSHHFWTNKKILPLQSTNDCPFPSFEKRNDYLGTGTFSDVIDGHMGSRQIALKLSKDSDVTDDFFKEDRFLRLLSNSDYVCNRLGIFYLEKAMRSHIGIALEKAEKSLSKEIYKDYNPLELSTIKKIGRQLINALSYLNSLGVIHLDIKPENILLFQDFHVKLCDFNSASFSEKDLQDSYFPQQTSWYRSPEGALEIHFFSSSDVWSLGVVLAELILKKNIFQVKKDDHLPFFHEDRLRKKYPEDLIKKASTRMLNYYQKNTPPKREKMLFVKESLFELIEKAFTEFPSKTKEKVHDFFKKAFEYDPIKRPTPAELSSLPFFEQVE